MHFNGDDKGDNMIKKQNFLVKMSFLLVFLFLLSTVSSAQQMNSTNMENLEGNNSSDDFNQTLALFDAYFKDLMQKSGVPGAAVAIVHDDKVVYLKCLGVKKVGTNDSVDSDTVFQIGSTSKAFTATTIASLVDKGLIKWDDRAIKYYPEFKLNDSWVTQQLTIRDMLCHRTGLPPYAGDDLIAPFNYTTSEILYRLRYLPLYYDFRANFTYQNMMYVLAGECAARTAGKNWSDLISEAIFQPLDMESTSTSYSDFINNQNRASNHFPINGTFSVVEAGNYDPLTAAGGISSNIKDMANYLRFQLNKGTFNGNRVVSQDSLGETHKLQFVMSNNEEYASGYALGWEYWLTGEEMWISHGGSAVSSTSYIMFFPKENLGIVVLTNSGPGLSFPEALTYTFKDLYYKGNPQTDYYNLFKARDPLFLQAWGSLETLPDKPETYSESLPLEAYTGTYQSDYYGDIRFVKNGSKLLLYKGKNQVPNNVTHWSGNIFKEESTNTAVEFIMGPDQNAIQVLVKMLAYTGRNATFNRKS